ncbi:MAG: endonuclease [Patescibacteria group bacterium]|nr:endonuclease [Patescibacteria group bacterium]
MNIFEELYKELKNKYNNSNSQWTFWRKRSKTSREKEEVIIGAILTQRTNWKNVELALKNLKNNNINSLKDIRRLGLKRLALLIKPSAFYRAKADCLFCIIDFIFKNYGGVEQMEKANLKELREQLLGLKGIGEETADSILLYALNKPIFVIDEYTRRLVKKRNIASNLSYSFLQELFEKNLRKDFRLYQDFHALIVIDAKNR